MAALAISLLIHLLFLLLVTVSKSPEFKPIEVSLLSVPTKKSLPQIVSPSEVKESVPDESTTRLSDKSTKTEKESIKRGLPEAGLVAEPLRASTPSAPALQKPKPLSKPKTAAASPPPKKASFSSKTSAKTLLTDPSLAAKIALSSKPEDNQASANRLREVLSSGSYKAQQTLSDAERSRKLYDYRPFQRRTAASLFSGRTGVPDHLPTIQDGDITILNAKADRHAVFVRRVALQVFGILRRLNWSEVSFSQVFRQTDFVTVYARMSKEGTLLGVELGTSSGVQSFDKVLLKAANEGTWDQNPPPSAAAEDGNIHFIFKSRTWAQRGAEGIGEQRWLLLATGLL